METTRQFSVFLENKPGRLAQVLSALGREKVNLLALTIVDYHEQAVLRFIPSDMARALAVLKRLNVPHYDAEVLLLELRNQPGALARICELLGANHLNIDYCYCSALGRGGRTAAVLKVSPIEKAMKLLGDAVNGTGRRRTDRPTLRDQRSYQAPR
jgi:hypothetical protein